MITQQEPERHRFATGSGAITSSDNYLGQMLNNRFLVEAKIGEGGFSTVYRGVQIATGRKVALKLLHTEKSHNEDMVARFRREAKMLCNLHDPHTITTYDFDRTPDGTLYIAMELLAGKSLAAVYNDEAPLAWERVLRIVREMCSSLAEAHARGIVHRDLKPENVFLESWPEHPEFVKVLDFGIAKPMRSTEPDMELTQVGETLGTLAYMSPEQLMSSPLDGQSDIYSLGVLAYEMMTGRLPYPEAHGPVAMITAQLMGAPPPPSSIQPNIPTEVDLLIGRCLESAKKDRFADVTELANAIGELVSPVMAALARPTPPDSELEMALAQTRPTPRESELELARPVRESDRVYPAVTDSGRAQTPAEIAFDRAKTVAIVPGAPRSLAPLWFIIIAFAALGVALGLLVVRLTS
ncbi:MAG TPA: serine/threonine-protein kinase [Kofleriaceae bacterium]|jgi:serine/threonine-protein kinase|nr:serine/threonine-protein kinase [Kofleriaceae bacterium]